MILYSIQPHNSIRLNSNQQMEIEQCNLLLEQLSNYNLSNLTKVYIQECILEVQKEQNSKGFYKSFKQHKKLFLEHLIKEEHIYPLHYFKKRYSLFGTMWFGIPLTLLFIFLHQSIIEIGLAVVLGLVVGFLLGCIKDFKIKKSNSTLSF